MPRIEFKEGAPARQGFYRVQLTGGANTIAEWREYDKAEGKRWWTYASDDPTAEKNRVALENVIGYAKVDDSAVAAFMKRDLTRAERIEKAYQDHVAQTREKPIWTIGIPESRRLHIDQEVTVGSLREARVAGLYEGGKVVVIEYRREQKAKGEEPAQLEPNPSYLVYSWIDVLPKANLVTGLVRPRRLVQPESVTQIQSLIHRMYMDETDDNPEYQRGRAWEPIHKEMYLDTFFNNRNLGRFVFVVDNRTGRIEVLDGKQRLNTLMELVTSTIPYRGVYWHQIPRLDRQQLMSQSVQFVDLHAHDFSRLDRLRIFREVNVAGVPQSPEHMRKIDEMIEEEEAKLGQAG